MMRLARRDEAAFDNAPELLTGVQARAIVELMLDWAQAQFRPGA